jgi:hypothetical protein
MFTAPFDMYFKGLESLGQGMGPMKGLARWQLEVAGFMNRRVQAYMEIPSRLSRCRTPQDLFSEQTRFWQTAFEQHSESSRRIMDAWAQVATPMGFNAQGSQRNDRDYISFSDPKDANGQDRRSRDRHAA